MQFELLTPALPAAPRAQYNSVKWNVPGARLSEIHPGGFISLIMFSLVISYANTLTVGDMGTQLSSGEIYLIKQIEKCESFARTQKS